MIIDERRTVNEALLQMASKHATNLHRLALVKIHTLKGFAPSVAEEVQPPKTVKIVAEEGDIPAAVKEVPAVAMTKSLDEEEDLHVAKKMRIIEHSEPAKGGAQDNIVSAPISV
ncbi:hypothetical protein EON65_10690 [archaeon]|nr:MAG: hypothetical protein EON65_10690 [archaeon]